MWTNFHWDEAKKNTLKKKIQNCRFKKTEIFNFPNSQYFFAKISGIDPWVMRSWSNTYAQDCNYTNKLFSVTKSGKKTSIPLNTEVNNHKLTQVYWG